MLFYKKNCRFCRPISYFRRSCLNVKIEKNEIWLDLAVGFNKFFMDHGILDYTFPPTPTATIAATEAMNLVSDSTTTVFIRSPTSVTTSASRQPGFL